MMNDPTHHSLQRAQGLPSARRCAPQAKEGAPIFFRACARRAASAGVCRGSALAAGRPPGGPPEAMVREEMMPTSSYSSTSNLATILPKCRISQNSMKKRRILQPPPHTGLSYDKALLPEARVTGLILNDIRKTRDAGY